MFELKLLPQGARFIYSSMKERFICCMGVFVGAGSRFEKKKIKGISHFFEHMVFKGTEKYSCKKIKTSIEGVGGYINAFTGKELTCFYVKIPSKYQIKALDVLLEMVFKAVFREEDIEKERKVIFEEIKMHKDLPHSRCLSLLEENMFRGLSLEEDVIGTEESVSSIKREDFIDFRRRFYLPSNMVISIAGNLEPEKIEKFLNKKLPSLGKKRSYNLKEKSLDVRRFIFEHKDISQVHVSIGAFSIHYTHPSKFIQNILHVILGANMSSRLFDKVREKKGYVYEISTFLRRYKDRGIFGVYLATSKNKLKSALKIVIEELLTLKNTLKDMEIKRAKEYLVGQMLMGFDSPSERMLYMGQELFYYKFPFSLEQLKEKIYAVSKKQIEEFTSEIFTTENLYFSVVGDIKEKKLEKIIHSVLR